MTPEAEAVKTMDLINKLSHNECDQVTIVSPNFEPFGAERVISCNGFWTRLKDRQFEGPDLISCLETAIRVKRSVESKGT